MMNIEKTQSENNTTLTLTGRLDTNTAPQLQEALISELEEARSVTLDFANLVYVSSAGLRVLLMGEKCAKTKNVRQNLVNVPDEVMEVFDMTGFTDILNID